MVAIGNVRLSSAAPADTLMPRIGMGTAAYPFDSSDAVRTAILRAIELGYRHFDTAALYQSEEPLGDAIADALRAGLISSRDDLFVTTKLWCSDAHAGRVIPALRNSLRNLKLECVDLYLVHWPVSVTPGNFEFPMAKKELMRMDVEAVWAEMEECQRLGLARSIGVSNFSCKKLEALCSFARIPPAVNQVEVNPLWQQKKLREYCVAKGIQLCAYSPLGAKGTHWGQDWVMNCQVLKDIAAAKGKSLAQICLRWVYEQGDCVLVKSFNEGRMMENLEILDWELSEEETEKIAMIPQCKGFPALDFVSEEGPYKYVQDLWDGEIC